MCTERLHRKVNTRMLIAYFSSLIAIQALGVVYFLSHPSLISGVAVGLLVGAVTPIVLGFILVRVVKTLYKEYFKE